MKLLKIYRDLFDMKNLLIIGFSLLVFGSCSMDQEPDPDRLIGGDMIITRLRIVIADQELQDRLNPESPSYYGEDYAKKIKILYLHKGFKFTFLEVWPYTRSGQSDPPEDYEAVQRPFRTTADYGNLDQNTLGYYFLYADPFTSLAVDDFLYMYVQYPDGKEDEIKIQLFRNKEGTWLIMRNIWVNDERIYGMSGVNDELIYTTPERYYNPKYYPFLEPVLDDDRKQIKDYVRPVNGTDIVVIRK